jgi:hypothetical protein
VAKATAHFVTLTARDPRGTPVVPYQDNDYSKLYRAVDRAKRRFSVNRDTPHRVSYSMSNRKKGSP